jgi:hypothetical protein
MRRTVLVLATLGVGCGGNSSHDSTPDAAILDAPFVDAPFVDAPFVDAPFVDAPIVAHRELGIEVDQPPGFDQGAQIDIVKPFGVSAIQLTIPWGTLEPDGNGFDQNTVSLLQFGMSYYKMHGVHVVLSVPIVDTVGTFVPSDLAGAKLDSAAVVARAEAMIAKVLAQCGPELEYLVLSNEVDLNLADGTPTWAELAALVTALAAKAHALRPDVKTGVSVTAGALLSSPPNADAVAVLADSDVAFVTYYHAGNFGTSSKGSVEADLAAIVGATSRPVVFKEYGYATGPLIGGSDDDQVQFVIDTFAAWDRHADRIPFVMYSRMFDNDMPTCVQEAADYGDPGDQAFIQFLCTLGLRSFGDVAKPAWAAFTAAAQARTWQ